MDQQIRYALRFLGERFGFFNIDYVISGSANLLLHGMDVSPRDIDIITRIEELDKIENNLKYYIVSGKRRMKSKISNNCYEIGLKVNGIDVQVIGDEDSIYGKNYRDRKTEAIRLDEVDLQCFTLLAEEEAYRQTGREEKAKRIRDFVSGK